MAPTSTDYDHSSFKSFANVNPFKPYSKNFIVAHLKLILTTMDWNSIYIVNTL